MLRQDHEFFLQDQDFYLCTHHKKKSRHIVFRGGLSPGRIISGKIVLGHIVSGHIVSGQIVSGHHVPHQNFTSDISCSGCPPMCFYMWLLVLNCARSLRCSHPLSNAVLEVSLMYLYYFMFVLISFFCCSPISRLFILSCSLFSQVKHLVPLFYSCPSFFSVVLLYIL